MVRLSRSKKDEEGPSRFEILLRGFIERSIESGELSEEAGARLKQGDPFEAAKKLNKKIKSGAKLGGELYDI